MTAISTLIERWLAGDERAAEALYDRHWDQTFWLAYGLLGDPDDAEEVAQDALYYALANIINYDSQRASFSTWLHIITVSRCRNRRRRKRLHLSSLTAWLKRGGDVPDPTSSQEGQIIQQKFTIKFGTLSKRYPLLCGKPSSCVIGPGILIQR